MSEAAVSYAGGESVSGGISDASLVARAKSGDLSAFDQLVLRHQQMVFAVALRMLGDYDDATDVAQDAFVRSFQSLASFRGESKFSTWLVSIVMNLCRNRRRWWARRKKVIAASIDEPIETGEGETFGQQIEDPGPSPAEIAQRSERKQQLVKALQQLDEAHRTVLVLRDIEGFSYEEIAKALRCQIGTVKSRINRARAHLRLLVDGKMK